MLPDSALVRTGPVAALLVFLTGAGCSRVPAAGDAAAPTGTCALDAAPASVARADTLFVATTQPVDPSHVPAPANGAERLVFAQLYETLIDVDCEGRSRPALARSWTLDATRTRVTLTLREGARFWTGAPVLASDVVAAWRTTGTQPTADGHLARAMAERVTIHDVRTLTVSLPDTAWRLLAAPALSIYRTLSDAAWPSGSGPYRPGADAGSPAPGGVLLAPMSTTDPWLMFRHAPGDARDAIDAGADVIVAGDPAAVSYAATRPGLTAVPLPWTRTYALLLPAGERPAWPATLPDSQVADLRGSLARDAVRADARSALPVPPIIAPCGPAQPVSDVLQLTQRPDRRLVYRRADPVARALAERLVALEGSAVAAGLAPGEFERALRTAADAGYIVELPRGALAPCHPGDALDAIVRSLANVIRLVPLIDVREHAIVRRGAVPATVAWDGTLRFGGGASGSVTSSRSRP